MSWLLLLRKVPLAFWPLAFLLIFGVYQWHRAEGLLEDIADMRLEAAAEASRLEAANREVENAAGTTVQVLGDALAKSQKARTAERAAVDSRLRELAARYTEGDSGEAAAAARRCHDFPAAAVVQEQTRGDLVSLTDEADAITKRLVTLQQYVNEVCKPKAAHVLP